MPCIAFRYFKHTFVRSAQPGILVWAEKPALIPYCMQDRWLYHVSNVLERFEKRETQEEFDALGTVFLFERQYAEVRVPLNIQRISVLRRAIRLVRLGYWVWS